MGWLIITGDVRIWTLVAALRGIEPRCAGRRNTSMEVADRRDPVVTGPLVMAT